MHVIAPLYKLKFLQVIYFDRTLIYFSFFFFFRCLFQDGKAMLDLLATLWYNVSRAKNKATGLWSVNISSLNFGWMVKYSE